MEAAEESSGTGEHPYVRARSSLAIAQNDPEPIRLDAQARRAFALLYALSMTGDTASLGTLLRYAGETPHYRGGAFNIPPQACASLARALRTAGYPLDDPGLRRFKTERGFSPRVRIGPEVAAAYARFAQGVEARLNITEAQWRALGDESRRALQILLLMGRRPDELDEARRLLGVQNSQKAPRGCVLVGPVTAVRLVSWAHARGMSFSPAGLLQIQQAIGCGPEDLQRLAAAIGEAVVGRHEPRHDYTRLTYHRHTLNRRTVAMLNKATAMLKTHAPFKVVEGSYRKASHRGAHPHMGGGAVDLELCIQTDEFTQHAIIALRSVGFAAWLRQRDNRAPHIHAVAIGDQEMSPAAAWQVRQYFEGRDGRTRCGSDPHVGMPMQLPAWTLRYRFLGDLRMLEKLAG